MAIDSNSKKINVTTKLLLSVFAIVLAIIAIQTWLNVVNAQTRNESEEKQNLIALYHDYTDEVFVLERASTALASSIADRSDVKQLLIDQNRAGLLDLLTPIFTTLQEDYDFVLLYLHQPNGVVFLRVHNPK